MAIFVEQIFDFAEGEEIPEHTDAWPGSEDVIDPTKYHIEGFHPMDGDFNFLAINIDDHEVAMMLHKAAKRQIDRTWDPDTVVALDPEEFKTRVHLIAPQRDAKAA